MSINSNPNMCYNSKHPWGSAKRRKVWNYESEDSCTHSAEWILILWLLSKRVNSLRTEEIVLPIFVLLPLSLNMKKTFFPPEYTLSHELIFDCLLKELKAEFKKKNRKKKVSDSPIRTDATWGNPEWLKVSLINLLIFYIIIRYLLWSAHQEGPVSNKPVN